MLAYKYSNVAALQAGAMRVSRFAKENNITVSYVYTKYDRGLADYRIVCYDGTNYVIPANISHSPAKNT